MIPRRLFYVLSVLGCLVTLVITVLVCLSAELMRIPKTRGHVYHGMGELSAGLDGYELIENKGTDMSEPFKKSMDQVCKKLGLQNSYTSQLNPEWFEHVLVDDKYKVLYCEIAKVASTSWRRLFLQFTGRLNTTNPAKLTSNDINHKYNEYLNYLSKNSVSEIRYKLNNYFKFVIVREPMERILSAYRNKFTTIHNRYFQTHYGRMMIKRYRQNYTQEEYEKVDDVTFSEFVRYLIDPRTHKQMLNGHWIQYYKQCHPCLMRYDFVGKFEQIEDDSNYILDSISAPLEMRFPPRPSSYSHKKTSTVLTDYFSQIPEEDKIALLKMYHPDYVLFSYNYPDIMNASLTTS